MTSVAPSRTSGLQVDRRPRLPLRAVLFLRRLWRSRITFGNLPFWLIFKGGPYLAVYAVLYVANGFTNGWHNTYRINIAIDSPGDADYPWLAWPLSVAGWLAIPVLAGAVAGYVVSTSIQDRRRKPVEDLFTKDQRA